MAIFDPHSFDPTAFMSGQISSKLWMARNLEELCPQPSSRVFVLGGWYCVTNFILRSRDVLPIHEVYSFDADPEATKGALILNENWIYREEFKAVTQDVNTLDYLGWGLPPDIVINTSTEHMEGRDWFDNIPQGTWVVLQSTNMPDDDHHHGVGSLEELKAKFPLDQVFADTLHVDYETWSFDRFMVMGRK